MDLSKIKKVYLIGIGGIGMSAIACYFKAQGKLVCGYDKTPTPLTDKLLNEDIDIHFEDDIDLISNIFKKDKASTLIVYTPAVPLEHSELDFYIKNGFTVKKRAEVLGLITEHSFCMAVAGTHGKTTTSTMLAHILKESGEDINAFMGGIALNYNSNFIIGSSNTTVVEADEFDRSFLTLSPDIAAITSTDADHLDIYGDKESLLKSFKDFTGKLKPYGSLIVKKGLEFDRGYTYSITEDADYTASNIRVENGQFVFDVKTPRDSHKDVVLGLPGRHNVENAMAALAMATEKGLDLDNIVKALATYKGVKRRFEYHIRKDNLVYIDDYAHHPEELKAAISAVQELYPNKKVTGVFQPHLFSRTRDFGDEFARSLELLDELILVDIYPAREEPIEGITAEWLFEKINLKHKKLLKKEDLPLYFKEHTPEVLVTLGAGDIDKLIVPIKRELEKVSK